MSELRFNRENLTARSPDQVAQALQGLQNNSHVVIDLQTVSGSGARLRHSGALVSGEAVPAGSTTTVYTVLAALAASRRRALRLSIRGLSAALPEPSTELLELLQQSDGIEELQLDDISIERLAQEGAGNLLRDSSTPPVPAWSTASMHPSQTLLAMPATPINNSAGGAFSIIECGAAHPGGCALSSPSQANAGSDKLQDAHQCQSGGHAHKTQPRMPVSDDFRARGTGLLRLAAAMPSLRRLSLRAAVFPAAEVAALAAALPLLEELSLDGAMEVDAAGPAAAVAALTSARPGAAMSAAAATSAAASHVYKGLLAALPRLRLLRLPMPLAAPQQRPLLQPLAAAAAMHSPFVADRYVAAAGLPAPLPLLYDSDDEDDFDCYSLPSTYCGGSNTCSGSSSSIFGSWSVAGSTASGADGAGVAHCAGSWGRAPTVAGSSFAAPDANPKPLSVSAAAAESGWTFSSRLSEFSVPMCAANGPVFFAALSALGGCTGKAVKPEVEADPAQERGGLRALHVPCPAGYSPWDGAFLKSEQDFAALAGLAPALEVLHLALPPALTAPAAAGLLRACLGHLAKLQDVKELRVIEAKLPACFSVRKHAPAPAEYLAFRSSGRNGAHTAASAAASRGAALLPCLVRGPGPAPAFKPVEVPTPAKPSPAAVAPQAVVPAPPPVTPAMLTPPPRRLAPPPSPSPVPWQPAATCSAFRSAAASHFALPPSGPSPNGGLALGSLPPLPALQPRALFSATPGSGAAAFSCAAEPAASGPGALMPSALMSGPSIFSRAAAVPGSARAAARALSFGGPTAATAASPAAPATPAAAATAAVDAAVVAAGVTSSAALLSQLLLQWPRLQSVVLLGHSVVRTPAAAAGSGAACLVSPSSLEELMALRQSALRGSSFKGKSKSSSDNDGTDTGGVSGGGRGSRRTRSLVSQFAAARMAADDAADAHRHEAKRRRHDRAVAAAAATASGGIASSGLVTDASTDSDDQQNSPMFRRSRACGACFGYSRGGSSSSSASGGSSCGSGDEGDASDIDAAAGAQRQKSRLGPGSCQDSLAAALAKRCN
ncbi:hypothetical protein HXX76_005226 [Chlamydomonas incerta]|uniref:Uncharacterized protein n=1 Tax=Chlamydomonas incerta TaxID=51695 RepID=A0A835TE30_CHLIN|nr:hypothetical protein HXX76_005226 [Chlamydomonas incerta]|eukprot:KAG2438679.1 hypothetical protein HXX76_005226 [Chlamydomonas incerta]